MHCGPVRHRIRDEAGMIQDLHVHPTGTTIRDDIGGDTPGILQSIIIPALVADTARTAQIAGDVARANARGRYRSTRMAQRGPGALASRPSAVSSSQSSASASAT
jgi:hypothetical protein